MADAPPIVVRLGLLPVDGETGPPITASVAFAPIVIKLGLVPSDDDVTPPDPGTQIDMPPAVIGIETPDPEISTSGLLLSAPGFGAVLPTNLPAFTVAVTLDDDQQQTDVYTIEVQYADNPAFTNATTLSAPMLRSDGGGTLNPTATVPTPGWWRARLLAGTVEVFGWTGGSSFTVATVTTPTYVNVGWNITGTADRPIHFWHLDPDGAEVGDVVTIYGQGFPATGFVKYNDENIATVTSWKRVPATIANTTADRRISGSDVTCEHYEITFTAPVDDGRGAILSVEA